MHTHGHLAPFTGDEYFFKEIKINSYMTIAFLQYKYVHEFKKKAKRKYFKIDD